MTNKCAQGAFPVQSSLGPGSEVEEKAKKRLRVKTAERCSGEGKGGALPPPHSTIWPLFQSVSLRFFAIQVPPTAEAGPWLVQSSRRALRAITKTKLMKKRQEHITRMNKEDNVF